MLVSDINGVYRIGHYPDWPIVNRVAVIPQPPYLPACVTHVAEKSEAQIAEEPDW